GLRGSAVPDDYRDPTAHQVCRQLRQPILLPLRPAVLHCDILAIDEARLLQTLLKRRHEVRRVVSRSDAEKPDYRHRRLLRTRRERPSDRSAAEECDERAPSHSITSSARSRNDFYATAALARVLHLILARCVSAQA